MKFYIECRNVFNREELFIENSDGEQIGNISFKQKDEKHQIVVKDLITESKLLIKSNPLKPKKRFMIHNSLNKVIGKVSMGVKIIHSIIELEKYYFVKSAFWKIKYTVYDNRTVSSTLNLVRKNKKRFYEIEMKDKDLVMITSMFLLAHAVRLKSIIN